MSKSRFLRNNETYECMYGLIVEKAVANNANAFYLKVAKDGPIFKEGDSDKIIEEWAQVDVLDENDVHLMDIPAVLAVNLVSYVFQKWLNRSETGVDLQLEQGILIKVKFRWLA